jgi:hypothetical protein
VRAITRISKGRPAVTKRQLAHLAGGLSTGAPRAGLQLASLEGPAAVP